MKSRWSIPALCAFFVAVGIAVSGCGSSIPSGSVASVAGNPISQRAVDHFMYLIDKEQSSQSGGGTVIVPNDPPQFTGCITQARAEIASVKTESTTKLRAACKFLIPSYWAQAQAHREGVTVSDAAIQQQIDLEKTQNKITSNAQFQALLAEQGTNLQDLEYETRVELLEKKLAAKQTAPVTSSDIADYYAKNKSKFGSPESRNLRIVLAKSRSQAQAALTALHHGQSWGVVAKKYSEDPQSKNSGGLLTNVTVGSQDQSLTTAAFAAPANKLIGPVKATFGWYVIEVIKITPATQQSLAKATPSIKASLTSTSTQAAETTVANQAKKAFLSKTTCASAYAMSDCHGYKAPKTSSSSASASATATSPTATSSTTSTTSSP